MLFDWIKSFIESKCYNDSYENVFEKERYKADLINIDAGWTNLEFRTFK